MGQSSFDNNSEERLVKYARAIELGRIVGRDIGGADPERMAPPRVAEYVQNLFQTSSNVKVETDIFFEDVCSNIPRCMSSKIKMKSKRIIHSLLLLIVLLVVRNKIVSKTLNNLSYSIDINRHQGHLIFLEYTGEGEIDSTALLVGKGITYDTGGLDIKSTFNRCDILQLK